MICLIILPLNAIADEQLKKLVRSGAKPVLLNQKTNSKSTRETIANGHATHGEIISMASYHSMLTWVLVLTSPELALSKEFQNDILVRNTPFKRRLGLLAIDELHLVSQWDEFRPEYGQIHALRIRVGQDIPCVGLSATLSNELLRKAIKSCGFKGDVEILRSTIDRPNIHIQVQHLQHTKKSMDDLCRVLPMQYSGPCSIPKTLIHTQTIAEALQAMTRLRKRMMELGYPTEAAKLVKSFYLTINGTILSANYSTPPLVCRPNINLPKLCSFVLALPLPANSTKEPPSRPSV